MDMDTAINNLVNAINADYRDWFSRTGEMNEIRLRMIDEFDASIEIITGKKYIKIVKQGSVWGFIVNVDNDKKFRRGDILKAAGWNAPARNKARGNVFDDEYSITWTGPHYL